MIQSEVAREPTPRFEPVASPATDVLQLFEKRLRETEELMAHLRFITGELLPHVIRNRQNT